MEVNSLEALNNSTRKNYTREEKLLLWLKLSGLNLLAFGIELCCSAGFCYIPPLMLKKGFSESALTVIIAIGPFISVLFIPTIGRWSDDCTSQFGKRRPFIFIFGLLILLSLLVIPFSYEISKFSGILSDAYVLMIGVIIFDFSSQAVANPCKALIPDICLTREEQDQGFISYSIMLSMGGGIGYFLSSINWVHTSIGIYFGGQEKVVFMILYVMFLLLFVTNLILAKEVPHKSATELLSYNTSKPIVNGNHDKKFMLNGRNEFITSERLCCESFTFSRSTSFWKLLSTCVQYKTISSCFKYYSRGVWRLLFFPLKVLQTVKLNLLQLWNMPNLVTCLFFSCLFGWMGISCHDSYYTDFVGQVIYLGKPKADSTTVDLYNEGVRMGSWGMLFHCISGSFYSAFVQHRLITKIGQHKAYLCGMILFSLSLFGTVLTRNFVWINIFTSLSGAGYIALTTVPYSLITIYHNSKQVYGDGKVHGIGEEISVIDSATYLAQIVPSVFIGYIVDLTGSPLTYMITAALCGTAACYFSFYIKVPP